MQSIPRPEYPRPDFERQSWQSLNGEWEFSFDQPSYDRRILVPFCYQSKASGIGIAEDHATVWYRKTFTTTCTKGSALLHFGAVDYHARVWLNDAYLGEHKGGHTPFSFDVTGHIREGENTLCLRVDDPLDTDKPRGKQSWKGHTFACWYTPTTGIWQSVWLEQAGAVYLRRIKITPNPDLLSATCELFLSSQEAAVVRLRPQRETGESIGFGDCTVHCANGYGRAVLSFADCFERKELLWSPEHPNLIFVEATVEHESAPDRVMTYFGLRSVGAHSGQTALNNRPYYQRLVLDQGYWPDTLLTPPSDEAIREDILLTKAMGFNGARKHQKIEDPRYYYWADKLGLLVWGELPSAYQFNDRAIVNSCREMTEFIERDYNHPCIVAWVPLNESWGVPDIQISPRQQDYARALYYLIKALDTTRQISTNDGWEQVQETDICAVHDYALFPSSIHKYDDLEALLNSVSEWRFLHAEGNRYQGQPVMLTEYGGISFAKDAEAGWGYYEGAKDEEGFLERLLPITEFLIRSDKFSGFCYTQLTDVMQEVNGLLDENRKPKVPVERLQKVFAMRR